MVSKSLQIVIDFLLLLQILANLPHLRQPSWSVRTALLALIAFMPTKAKRAIGSLNTPDAERRRLAIKSRTWRCETCGLIKDLLKHPDSQVDSVDTSEAGPSAIESEPTIQQTQPTASQLDNGSLQNLAERRRSYPPLVLKSIFILISLLLLRRVVMVI